jgi:hypothetical protein
MTAEVSHDGQQCDADSMSLGRIAVVATCVVVAGLGTWFTFAEWGNVDRIATVVSALAAVAAVGVAIWAGSPRPRVTGTTEASRTGDAVARAGGVANTGVSGKGRPGNTRVRRTGNARADGTGSEANTGTQG